MKTERLLQTQGFGSRKECRVMIRAGLLSIEGQIIDDPFAEVDPLDLEFEVDGVRWRYREKAYLVLHKPTDYECSHKPQHHPSVFSLLPPELVRRDVQCVGRLDHDTTGLLLFSDDGQFIHYWSSGKKRIPKTYAVTLRHPVDDAFVQTLLDGVQLHDEPAPIQAYACELQDDTRLLLTVTEGKYHQVKRMISAAGNRVEALHRCAVGGLELSDELAAGEWRWLEKADLEQLSKFER